MTSYKDAGRQVRGGTNLQSEALPLIRPFGAPSRRKRGEGIGITLFTA
jgi:hypothetical protein